VTEHATVIQVPHVVALHVWPSNQTHPVPVPALECDWAGPQGDRHYGLTMLSDARQKAAFPRGTEIRNHRQVSIVDISELSAIAINMGLTHLEPGTIADNIATAGIPELTQLPPLTRLIFQGGVVIMTGGENLPCTIAGALVADHYGSRPESFPAAAMGLRGITGWIEHPGTIRAGEAVQVLR